jgi:hypothetical protein
MGIFLIHLGGKYYLTSIFVINSFGMMCLIMITLFAIVMPDSTPQFMVWACVIMSAVIGLGLGVGAYKWPKFGIVSIGLFAGSIIGVVFYVICFSSFSQANNDES